jgi:multiple sugar transport system substrate-binding protein
MRKWFVVCLIMGLLIGTGSFSMTEAAKEVRIRMKIDWAVDSGRGEAIRQILNRFEAENSGIKVDLIGGSQNSEALLTQLLSGDAPEVVQVAYRNLRSLASYGAFMELTKTFGKNRAYFYTQLWDLAVVDRKLYGYPWLGHAVQMIYNKSMFQKAGLLRAPQTWDELYTYAKKLTRDTNNDGKIDQWGIGLVGKQHYDITWMFNMFATQAGAKLVKPVNGQYRVAINSPQGLKALQFYIKLIRETAPPDSGNKMGSDIMADFRNQVVAMEFQGPWGVTDIWKAGNPFEVAAAPVPAGPAGRGADIGPYMLAIPTGVKDDKLDAALKLIDFLGSKGGQAMLMNGEKGDDGKYYPFRVPVRKDLHDSKFFKEHPEFLVFIEGLQYPSISTPVEGWAQVEAEVYQSQLNQAVIGKITPAQALANIEKQGNKVLEQYYKK